MIPVTSSLLPCCLSAHCSAWLLTCIVGSWEFTEGVKDMDRHLYILKDMLCLNVVVLFPEDPERDRDV